MGLILLMILAGGGFYYYVYQRNKNLENDLLTDGLIIQRRNDFYKLNNTFYVMVRTIKDIDEAVDHTVLMNKNIHIEQEYGKGRVIYRNRNSGGSFVASLQYIDRDENGKDIYEFRFHSWTTIKDGRVSLSDYHNANILLTAIEKAFYSLDNTAVVERTYAKYNTKTNFF